MSDKWQILQDGTFVPFSSLGFDVLQHTGGGLAPSQVLSVPYTTQPGAHVIRTKVGARVLTLAGVITGTTVAEMHQRRRALIEALLPFDYETPRPLVIRYTGASIPLMGTAYYHAGLEASWADSGHEIIPLQLLLPSPYWYGEPGSAELSFHSTLTLSSTLLRYDTGSGGWEPQLEGTISAIAPYRDGLLIGGTAIVAAGPSGTTILGTISPAAGSLVTAIAVMPNGSAFTIGGDFTEVNGVSAPHLAHFDGTTWQTLGTLPSAPWALCWGENGTLYVGGSFAVPTTGGGSARHLAQWTGERWDNVGGTFPSGPVTTLCWANDTLYIGGSFNTIGTLTLLRNVARWDGGTWHRMDTGLSQSIGGADGIVNVLSSDPDGFIYAGGRFVFGSDIYSPGLNSRLNNIARWDGSLWTPLHYGLFSQIFALDASDRRGVLAGGSMTYALAAWGNAFQINQNLPHRSSLMRWAGKAWFPRPVDSGTFDIRQIVTDADGRVFVRLNWNAANGVLPSQILQCGTVTVVNNGGAAVTPTFTIRGPIVLLQIHNATTSKTLHLGLVVGAYETVTIDLNRMRVTSDLYGSRLDRLLVGSHVSSFVLQPGENVLSVWGRSVTTYVTPTPSITVDWLTTYWSVDS